MATKRKAFVHIGLDGSGDFVDGALEHHQRALAELGVCRPVATAEEMFRAAIEILRTHREWGYLRGEVEGTWTRVVRRGHKGKDTLIFSQTLLAAARPEQVSLLVDALAGFEVHVVVTTTAPDAWTVPGDPQYDLGAALVTWGAAVKRPQHLHVIVADIPSATWRALGRIVGFGTSSLRIEPSPATTRVRPPHLTPSSRGEVLHSLGRSWVDQLTHSEHDVVGDLALLVPSNDIVAAEVMASGVTEAPERALRDALVEIERLTRRNESLKARLESPLVSAKERKKLKRRLSAVA